MAKALVLLVTQTALTCDRDPSSGSRVAQVETLADGSVLVTNSSPRVWSEDSGARWRVAESVRIGTAGGDGPARFGDVRSVVVDDLDRMWVVDALANDLRVFRADGTFVRAIGGPGEGPSEFRRIGDAFRGPEGEIWVEGLALRRWEVFDTTGKRIEGHPVVSSSANAPRAWTRQGSLTILDGDAIRFFKRVNGTLRGDARRWHLPPPPGPELISIRQSDGGPEIQVPPPFSVVPAMFLGSEMDLWLGQGDGRHYEIRRVALDVGNVTLTIRREYHPLAIPDQVRATALELFRERYLPDPASRNGVGLEVVPRVYPPFRGLHVATDGYLWVRRMVGGGIEGFDVFRPDGHYVGQPEMVGGVLSPTMEVEAITDRAIVAIDTDDLGVDYVVWMDIWK